MKNIWTLRAGAVQNRPAFLYELNGKPAKLVFAPYLSAEAIRNGISRPDMSEHHASELARIARTYPDAKHGDGCIFSPQKSKLKWSTAMTDWSAIHADIAQMKEIARIDQNTKANTKKTTATNPPQSTEHTEPIQTDRPAPLALPGRQKYVVVRILNGSIVVEIARFETAAAAHDWCNLQPDEYESDDNFLDVYHIRNLPRLLRSAA